MESIKKIYRKGYGPSSSHTMGPHAAALQFKTDHPDAHTIRVTLYGSLAATGRGHHTDKALLDGAAPIPIDITNTATANKAKTLLNLFIALSFPACYLHFLLLELH